MAPPPLSEPDAPPPIPALEPTRPAVAQTAALMVACVLVNLVGREFVDFLDVPVYLDMVGTALAAIALGPWHGAAVGATTNVVGSTWSAR